MAQTLVRLLVHVVFSTKNRQKLIASEIEPDLYAYLGGIARDQESRLLAAGGDLDHVHLLLSQSKNLSLSVLVGELKKGSSVWIKRCGPAFVGFHWQDGYAGFSIGQSQIPALKRYLARQKEHHKRNTFEEEVRGLLEKYEIEYDESYIWS